MQSSQNSQVPLRAKKSERVRSTNFKFNQPKIQFPSAASTGTHKTSQMLKSTLDYAAHQTTFQDQQYFTINNKNWNQQQPFNIISKNQKMDPLQIQNQPTMSTMVVANNNSNNFQNFNTTNHDNDGSNNEQQMFHTIGNTMSQNKIPLSTIPVNSSIQDYQSQVGISKLQPLRMSSNTRPNIHSNYQQHQEMTLSQYSSIPVKMGRGAETSAGSNHNVNKSFQKSSQRQLTKLYGPSQQPKINFASNNMLITANDSASGSQSGHHRRYVKSVERRSKPEMSKKLNNFLVNQTINISGVGNNMTNYPQQASNINTRQLKADGSFNYRKQQLRKLVTGGEGSRESGRAIINNSTLSAINIYESAQTLNNSIDSGRFKYKLGSRSNIPSLKTSSKNKHYIQMLQGMQSLPSNNNVTLINQSTSKSPQKRQLSSIGLKSRYNLYAQQQHQQPSKLDLSMQSQNKYLKPLEEMTNSHGNQIYQEQFESNQLNISQQHSKQNPNEMSMVMNNSQVNFGSTNQLASKVNFSTIIKNKNSSLQNVNSPIRYPGGAKAGSRGASKSKQTKHTFSGFQTQNSGEYSAPTRHSQGETTTTDTVMFLKKQEIMTKSNALFEEGKSYMHSKNYKEAIKAFSSCLKLNNACKEAKYYRAICYLDSENTQKCITELSDMIETDPVYNQTIYIIWSIAFRRTNDLANAVKALSKGLIKFPKYVQAYQARGQIYIFLKKWEKALIDFQQVTRLEPSQCGGYIGLADSLKGMGNTKGALESYTKALTVVGQGDKKYLDQTLSKRGILNYQLKNFDASQLDFSQLLAMNDKNCKAHYYKGKTFKKLKQQTDASLHFEQVIKWSNENQEEEQSLAGSALFEIAKIRIKQKDFYEAYHNIQRAVHFHFKSKKFLQYKLFLEGVLFIMKRKVKKGVKILSSLVDSTTYDPKQILNSSTPIIIGGGGNPSHQNLTSFSNKENLGADSQQQLSNGQLKSYLQYLILIYRSYGYIMLQQHDKALHDLNRASKIRKLNQACIYNRYIVKALIKIDKKDFNGVRQILKQAELKFPLNKDPYKYQAMTIVHESLSEAVDVDNPKKKEKIVEALSIICKGLENHPKEPSLLYLKGLLSFYMHQFYDSIVSLDAVIDIEEEPTAKQYLARGRCHACLSMFQEAIEDLTKAIELDDELSDAYFNRGKCAYLLGDTALAFLDFQKLILLEPKNPMVHIYAGNLLMTTGSYDDATKAFTNADSVQKSSLAFYQRARCHIALANMEGALKDLNIVVERTPQDKIAFIDRECLSALKQAISAGATNNASNTLAISSGNNVTSPISGQGLLNYDSTAYEKAAIVYTRLLASNFDGETNSSGSDKTGKLITTTAAMRMHQQIIPNVKRIKIEKTRALRRKRAKQEYFKNTRKAKKKIIFNYTDEADETLVSQAAKVTPFSYYKENIFGSEDFYLYRGVMNFYSGEYKKAIKDYQDSVKVKQQQKDESGDNDGNNGGDNQSQSSNQTDLSDVGLCSLNVHESIYNIILCLIQLREYKEAATKLTNLMKQLPKKYCKQMWLLRGLLYQAVGGTFVKLAQQDFEQAMKTDNQAEQFLNNKTPIYINPFPVGNRLCSQFQEIKIMIQGAPTYIYAKPSFSFPFVKPPNMIPNVDEKIMQSEFNMKNVAPPKPEAPWIKRCDYGIKFTDEIQIMESNPLGSDTEEESSNQENQNETDSRGEDQQSQNEGKQSGHPNNGQVDINKLDERHYLRAYLQQEREQLKFSVSERIFDKNRQDKDLFGDLEEDYLQDLQNQRYENEYDDSDEDDDDFENEEEDDEIINDDQNINQANIQRDLYGEADQMDSSKNIIVDDQYDDFEFQKESS